MYNQSPTPLDSLEYLRENFLRQRRNLIAVSMLLFFYQSSGIKINHINVLGTQLLITNAARVSYAIWAAWAYFLIRYFQYFRDIGDKGFTRCFKQRELAIGGKKANALFRKKMISEEVPIDEKYDLKKIYHYPSELLSRERELSFRIHILYRKDTKAQTEIGSFKQDLSFQQTFTARAKALFAVVFGTRLATEFVLPYMVAAIPIAYSLLKFL